jgi:hypothetical protein
VCHQRGYLIAKECAFKVTVEFSERAQEGNLDMAITDSSHAWRPSPPLTAWTIAVLAGFGILHVVGGYVLHHAPSIRLVETPATTIYGD